MTVEELANIFNLKKRQTKELLKHAHSAENLNLKNILSQSHLCVKKRNSQRAFLETGRREERSYNKKFSK